MPATIRWVGLALLGLLIAAGVSIAASGLASQQIGLASEPISAGDALAPQAPSRTKRHEGHLHETSSAKAPTTPPPISTAPPPGTTGSQPPAPVPPSTVPAPPVPSGSNPFGDEQDHSGGGGHADD